jgi:hypothetical protein
MWLFGNVKYSGHQSFVNVLLKRINENYIEMINGIFSSGDKTVCIAISVTSMEMLKEDKK